VKNYIVNGRVAREEIAADICDGVLSREDIKHLVEKREIRDAFIGTSYSKKTDQKNWDDQYLKNLPDVSVAEAFNEDYMYYLADVAEYVKAECNKRKIFCIKQNRTKILVLLLLSLLLLGGLFIYWKHSRSIPNDTGMNKLSEADDNVPQLAGTRN